MGLAEILSASFLKIASDSDDRRSGGSRFQILDPEDNKLCLNNSILVFGTNSCS